MQITIFSGFSKEHNSTKQPSGGTVVNCYLKDDTSLINPVFVLDSANFSVNYVVNEPVPAEGTSTVVVTVKMIKTPVTTEQGTASFTLNVLASPVAE